MVRALRESSGLTRSELARRAEVDQSHLARFEYGHRRMSYEKVWRALGAIAEHVAHAGRRAS